MNKTLHLELFNQLQHLVTTSDAFFRQDFTLDGIKYGVYNYRLASYTDFMQPGALEARGIMFELDDSDQMVRLACWPQHKFFNLNENPSVMNLDLSVVVDIEEKRDGSLISTYIHKGELRLKTKGSLTSEQAVDAEAWLSRAENAAFKAAMSKWTHDGYTINLEWTAPHNRIVIGYMKPALTILNVRHLDSGDYLANVEQSIPELAPYVVMSFMKKHNIVNFPEFVASIASMLDDIEGFVVKTPTVWFKCKTDKYCSLHHAKDSINIPRRLFECVLDEAVDDLLSMFATDELAVAQIKAMQLRVGELYNSTVAYVEKFYHDNKHLDRKDYAIKGRAEVNPQMLFGLCMNLYLDKPNDYKQFFKSHYKEYGFKDVKVEVE